MEEFPEEDLLLSEETEVDLPKDENLLKPPPMTLIRGKVDEKGIKWVGIRSPPLGEVKPG